MVIVKLLLIIEWLGLEETSKIIWFPLLKTGLPTTRSGTSSGWKASPESIFLGKHLLSVVNTGTRICKWVISTFAKVLQMNSGRIRNIDLYSWNTDMNQIILLPATWHQASVQIWGAGMQVAENGLFGFKHSTVKEENQKPFRTCSLLWGFGNQTIFWAVKWWQQSRNSCWVWTSPSRLLLSNLPEADPFLLPCVVGFVFVFCCCCFVLFCFFVFFFWNLNQFCTFGHSWLSLSCWLVLAGWFSIVDQVWEAGKIHGSPETQLLVLGPSRGKSA